MKAAQDRTRQKPLRGFSLIELMAVIAILSVVTAAILTQLEQMQQRAVAEQGKVDDFQQARDFLDQIFRDTRQMGYPNIRNFSPPTGGWTTPLVTNAGLAAGLVKLTSSQLEFQGDVDGSGNVSVVSYMVNGNGSCSTCIQRAQVLKVLGDPVTGQSNLTASAYSVEIQNVQNTSSIFTAYDASGNSIALPIDIDNNPTSVASVRVIQVNLSIASPTAVDPKTGQQLEADVAGRVQVLNCSMATTGLVSATNIKLTCQ
jgi:prepilin-type N-terminal cleavage/methylation domain-containing protein